MTTFWIALVVVALLLVGYLLFMRSHREWLKKQSPVGVWTASFAGVSILLEFEGGPHEGTYKQLIESRDGKEREFGHWAEASNTLQMLVTASDRENHPRFGLDAVYQIFYVSPDEIEINGPDRPGVTYERAPEGTTLQIEPDEATLLSNRHEVDTVPVSSNEEQVSQLVLLVNEEIPASKLFVRGAVEHSLGLTLPINDADDATEFVTGVDGVPIFHIQFQDVCMSAAFIPCSYFSANASPFVEGNPINILRNVKSPELWKAVNRHRMWVSVTFVMHYNEIETVDEYGYIGKFLSAFAKNDIVEAVIWPQRNAIVRWNPDMLPVLQSGDPLRIFGA